VTPLTPIQKECLGFIQQILGSSVHLSWIRPSWIMALIRIESGWQPLVVNATGRQDGLMQVIPATASSMEMQYRLPSDLPQTDVFTSINTGTHYVDYCGRYLLRAFGTPTIPLGAVIESYNEGPGAVLAGRMVSNYYLKWAAAQQSYAFVDMASLMVGV
jgi:soluble lytic murein transglycosylase-like protein